MSERKVIPENGRIDELIASMVVAGVRCQDANADTSPCSHGPGVAARANFLQGFEVDAHCSLPTAEAAELLTEWMEGPGGQYGPGTLRDRTWKWLGSTVGSEQ